MKAKFFIATLVLLTATACRDLPEASYPEMDGEGERSCVEFETVDQNDCDGHQAFSLELLQWKDGDGDGVWEEGESVELSIGFSSTEEHMNYPGILVHGLEELDAGLGYVDETWWYGVTPESNYEWTFTLTPSVYSLLSEPGPIVFTAAVLGCGDDYWGECPHPVPLLVELPLE